MIFYSESVDNGVNDNKRVVRNCRVTVYPTSPDPWGLLRHAQYWCFRPHHNRVAVNPYTNTWQWVRIWSVLDNDWSRGSVREPESQESVKCLSLNRYWSFYKHLVTHWSVIETLQHFSLLCKSCKKITMTSKR